MEISVYLRKKVSLDCKIYRDKKIYQNAEYDVSVIIRKMKKICPPVWIYVEFSLNHWVSLHIDLPKIEASINLHLSLVKTSQNLEKSFFNLRSGLLYWKKVVCRKAYKFIVLELVSSGLPGIPIQSALNSLDTNYLTLKTSLTSWDF